VLLQHIQTDNTCSNSIPYSPSTELQPATNQNTSTTLPGTTPTSVPMVHIKTPIFTLVWVFTKKKTESKSICFLTVRLVNSEHRIGIFACKNIKPGTELLLDYGSDFFFKTQTIPISTTEKN